MHKGKIALKNPGEGGYRVPAEHLGNLRHDASKLFVAFFGEVVNRVGTYEDCNSLEEFNRARKMFGLDEIKK